MATTPTVPNITTPSVPNTPSWFKIHERLIICILAIIGLVFVGNKILNVQAAHDKAVSDAAVQELAEQKNQNAAILAQVKQTTEQYQAIVTQLTEQNAQLAAGIQQRTVVLQQQVKADAALPLPDLGARLAQLAAIKPVDISATPTGIMVTQTGALQITQVLEQVPVLQANLADETSVSANKEAELNKANDLITGLNTQVSNLQSTVTDQDKTCKAQIASANASARRGKVKWFLYGAGVGAGAVTALVIHALL